MAAVLVVIATLVYLAWSEWLDHQERMDRRRDDRVDDE